MTTSDAYVSRLPFGSMVAGDVDLRLGLLSRADSGAHLVQFYDDDAFLTETVCEYIAAGLGAGDPVIAIATPAHRDAFIAHLNASVIDTAKAIATGRLTFLDAAETLATFMNAEVPDAQLFKTHVGGVLAALRSKRESRRVRAYGEMVDLLWKAGNRQGAIALEELWNDLAKTEKFTLVCGYSMDNFVDSADAAEFQRVCSAHSHVFPTEEFSKLTSEEDRLREVGILQQRSRSLAAEIEHRKEVETSLRQREAELRDFLENAVEGIHWVAEDGTILFANKAELDLLGYSKEEYVGQHIAKFHADADVISDILARLCGGEHLANYEARLRCKDGSIKHVLINSNVLFRDGKFVHTRCFTRDVTDRKQAEDRLRRAEERFRRMHDAMPDGLGIFSPVRDEVGAIRDFRYVYLNPITARQVGRTAEDLLGRTLLEVFPGLDQTEFWKAFCRVANGHETETYEQPYAENGWRGWFRNTVVSIGEEIAVSYSDISDRKQAEDALRFLAEASNILASSLDYDTTLASVARLAVPTIADWATVDMLVDGSLRRLAVAHVDEQKVELARDVERRFPTDLGAPNGIANVLRTGTSEMVSDITDELLVAAIPDAELLGIIRSLGLRSTICVPLRARGRVVGAMTLFFAESGRRYSESDLQLAEDLARRASVAIDNAVLYRAAEEANQAKDDFLATVSHELRTPLNAILGWVRMLREDSLPQDRRARALETVERSARAQHQLIEDLLDVSRIVSGKLRIDVQTVDLPQIVERAIETVRPAATAKEIRLCQAVDPRASPVMGDAERLQQVVWNLLSNAVKFSDKGTAVYVAVQKLDSSVEIIVRDEGVGIEPRFLPHVFERFRQADARTSRTKGGLGLGLAIVRNLVELQGGTVRAESEGLGKGATFTVSLPLSPVRTRTFERPPALHLVPAAPSTHAPPQLEGLNVLVVDDEVDARDLLAEVLGRCKLNVTTAHSAEEALRLVQELRPDLVVSDIGMPEQDGYSFIKRLRALPAERGGKTPTVALTAYARTEDRTKALVAGFNMHVPKPVEAAELIAVLASLASAFPRSRT